MYVIYGKKTISIFKAQLCACPVLNVKELISDKEESNNLNTGCGNNICWCYPPPPVIDLMRMVHIALGIITFNVRPPPKIYDA